MAFPFFLFQPGLEQIYLICRWNILGIWGFCAPQDKGQCLWKDHCPLLEANSIFIEILMLEKVCHLIAILHARHFMCSYSWGSRILGRERKEHKTVSPAIVSDETFFSTNKRVCIKCAAIKVNHVILTGGSKGQFILDQEIISITFRVNNTGSSSQPPVHVHSRAPLRPASQPSATAPGLTQRQGPIEGHINHTTQTSKAKDNWITWLSAVMNTRHRSGMDGLFSLHFQQEFQLLVSTPASNGYKSAVSVISGLE